MIHINTWIICETNDIEYIISKSLRDYRKKHKLTQKELAKKVGIRKTIIKKLEAGIYNTKIELLVKIWNKLSTKDENFGKELLKKIADEVNRDYEARFKEE